MWYVCDVLYAVLYVRVSCFVVRGCAFSRRYINVCNCDMFGVVNVYIDHLCYLLCVLMVEGMSVIVNVMLSLMSVMRPPPVLCNLSARTVVKLCTCVCCRAIRLIPFYRRQQIFKVLCFPNSVPFTFKLEKY